MSRLQAHAARPSLTRDFSESSTILPAKRSGRDSNLQVPPSRGGSRYSFNAVEVHPQFGESRPGTPLPAPLRRALESQFDQPLAGVRLHDDDASHRLARHHRANALTVGEDIYLGKGRLRPTQSAGRQLLGHEVAHVVQQRYPNRGSSENDAEAEARSAGENSLSASVLPPILHHLGPTSGPLRDAASLKAAMEDELDDFFVGIDNVWPQIRREPQDQRDIVRRDPALLQSVRKEVDPDELLKTYLLLQFQKEDNFPAHYRGLIDATEGWGTHEARIFSILRGVSPTERQEMQQMPGVPELLEDELSSGDLTKARSLLAGQVEHQGTDVTPVTPSTHLEVSERFELSVEVRGSLETVENNLSEATPETPTDVLLSDTSLWAKIADEFNLQETWYLRMVTRYRGKQHFPHLIGNNMPAESFLFPIWEAVEGAGTDEEKLIDTLNLANRATGIRGGRRPRATDELLDDPFFVPMVEDELSGGDLKKALAAVSGARTATAAIRDALEDAIDDEDMDRIRRLLKDPSLSVADRQRLQVDPVILDEMGEELGGWKLSETGLLLKYGRTPFPGNVNNLLTRFRADPIDVPGTVSFLRGLAASGNALRDLREETGIYFMFTNSGLPADNRRLLIAALRADQPAYQEPRSEGTYRHHVENVSKTLTVHFTANQARVVLRCSIDKSRMRGDKSFDTDLIEDWLGAFDEIWNNRFLVSSNGTDLDLVFAPYIEVGISTPNVTIFVMNWKGRSFVRRQEMHLFLEDLEDKTVAHEFGHILGNPDEYHLTASEYRRITGTPGKQPFPKEGQTAEGLMGSQYESTAVHRRYALPALAVINSVRDQTKFPNPFTVRRK